MNPITFDKIFDQREKYFNMSEIDLKKELIQTAKLIEELRGQRQQMHYSLKILKKLAERFPSENQRQLALRVLRSYPQLHTPKQVQTVVYALLGKSTKDIASENCISVQAVKFIKTIILKKTGHKKMNELVAEIVQKEIDAN